MAEGILGSQANLVELRRQLAARLARLVIGCSGLLTILALTQWPFPLPGFLILLALLGLGWGTLHVIAEHPDLARHLLLWGLTLGLLAGMWMYSASWLPFMTLLLTFVGALLVNGGQFVSPIVILTFSLGLNLGGARLYPLGSLLVVLLFGSAVAWVAVSALYTALDWAWTMQQRSDHLLDLSRDRQQKLLNLSKSLEMSNTILQRTKRELIYARQQAEKAQRMKEQFAANVSHELRTPLNLILGFSEMMYLSSEVYGDMAWPQALRQDVYQIYSSSRHLTDMINDVLDLSRLEMVGFTLNKETVDIVSLLQETVDIARDFFRNRPISLELAADDLPTLEIDQTRIRQVLLNLLRNAAKFTDEGIVSIRAQCVEHEILVAVSDTGQGIEQAELAHIFEEFYQVDRSLHREHSGSGLGLAISKQFIEAHNGRIWAESRVGEGSTFYFSLPITDGYIRWARLEPSSPLQTAGGQPRSSVLVVDSDPAVADLVRRHLDGFEVLSAANLREAADAVQVHHPRALVLNEQPGADESRGVSWPVPVFRCSLPSQAWLADDLAVRACLTKPIAVERLLAEVEKIHGVRRVLVIDDDWGFCQLVDRMLESTGVHCVVDHAYDGATGLEMMRSVSPDLVLLDMVMPVIDGFGVLHQMREEPELAHLPVILVTATNFADAALIRYGSQVRISRAGGFTTPEVLQCLRETLSVLGPRYEDAGEPAV